MTIRVAMFLLVGADGTATGASSVSNDSGFLVTGQGRNGGSGIELLSQGTDIPGSSVQFRINDRFSSPGADSNPEPLAFSVSGRRRYRRPRKCPRLFRNCPSTRAW